MIKDLEEIGLFGWERKPDSSMRKLKPSKKFSRKEEKKKKQQLRKTFEPMEKKYMVKIEPLPEDTLCRLEKISAKCVFDLVTEA